MRLDELMRRGVPAQQRGEIWFEISGAQEVQQRWLEIYAPWVAQESDPNRRHLRPKSNPKW